MTKEKAMKIGDLAITHRGNYCIIVGLHESSYGACEWYNIVFCGSGNLRTGFPAEWLRRAA